MDFVITYLPAIIGGTGILIGLVITIVGFVRLIREMREGN